MNKSDVVKELISRGYNAILENGVVMIYMSISNRKINQVERLLKDIGYNASWGVKNVEEVAEG